MLLTYAAKPDDRMLILYQRSTFSNSNICCQNMYDKSVTIIKETHIYPDLVMNLYFPQNLTFKTTIPLKFRRIALKNKRH